MTLCFYICYIPAFDYQLICILTLMYTLSLFLTIFWGVRTTFIDPLDQVVAEEINARICQLPFDTKKYNQICTVCKTHVTLQSKHCGSCDKCIDGFDHHCNWLNNCIGKRNYSQFIYLIISLQSFVALQVSTGIFIIYSIITKKESTKENLFQRLDVDDDVRIFYVSLLLFFTFISAVILIINGNLVGFHAWLKFKKMRTYDFLLERRKKQKRRSKKIAPQIEEERLEEGNRTADRISFSKKEDENDK